MVLNEDTHSPEQKLTKDLLNSKVLRLKTVIMRYAFFKAKGYQKFRSRKNPIQSCFIPKSAIKPEGIYPKVLGKGLRYNRSLPESLMDSRLLWRAGKFFIALPRPTTRVLTWREPSPRGSD